MNQTAWNNLKQFLINQIVRFRRQIIFSTVVIAGAILLGTAIRYSTKFAALYPDAKNVLLAASIILIALHILKTNGHTPKIYRWSKRVILSIITLAATVFALLLVWYAFIFFPNDQKYLSEIADAVTYRGGHKETLLLDMITNINSAQFSAPLSQKDRTALLSPDLAVKDFYIDINPYATNLSPNNLKYATGRIFYYTYQKNCIVLKGKSSVRYPVRNGEKRFISLDAVIPDFEEKGGSGTINVYHIGKTRQLIFSRDVAKEKKPEIRPFRYSNPFKSILFYIKHPARTALTNYTGWDHIRNSLPDEPGQIEIEFVPQKSDDYLFLGSPKIFGTDTTAKKGINIVYLLFDTLAQEHVDLYRYHDKFAATDADEVIRELGARKALTPNIDRYAKRVILFNKLYSVGQVTRPSIVPLWTSRPYAKERMPVLRNIVSRDNQREYYDLGFESVPDALTRRGYFTKQISCNAQGHGVSGVGVDLGFEENYDYTMEPSEHPENARRVIEFLEENQDRNFVLYAHINTPHLPHWVPMGYYIEALWHTNFIHPYAINRANIRYLDDWLEKVMRALQKLHLDENTIVIVTADHTGYPGSMIRGEYTDVNETINKRESQVTATFNSRTLLGKSQAGVLYDTTTCVPWVVIPPKKYPMIAGEVNATVSALDIGPTFLDLTTGAKEPGFEGQSFKRLFFDLKDRDGVLSPAIPMIGRFQHAILLDGRYKYWQNLAGLYKYRTGPDGRDYLMQQEYLFDHKTDPYEIFNLALDNRAPELLVRIRSEFRRLYEDYPDKNLFQLSPNKDGKATEFRVMVESQGRIKYPRTYGDGVSFAKQGDRGVVFTATVKDKTLFFNFETDPPKAPVRITIYRDGKMIPRSEIFSAVEDINLFNNPIELTTDNDFYLAQIPARTGFEDRPHPGGISFYRIPLIYWLEMNTSEKDIKLSPGIKEVLRGWGYIQ
jgi:arylsulfatase A-like enzyme